MCVETSWGWGGKRTDGTSQSGGNSSFFCPLPAVKNEGLVDSGLASTLMGEGARKLVTSPTLKDPHLNCPATRAVGFSRKSNMILDW